MEITETTRNGATILHFNGRLDGATAAIVDDRLATLPPGQPVVILDLADLGYVSSAGLRVLLKAAKRAKSENTRLLLAGLQPMVREVFDISGFTTMFALFHTRDDALAST